VSAARGELRRRWRPSLREKKVLACSTTVKINRQLISRPALLTHGPIDDSLKVFFVEFLSRIKSWPRHDSLFATVFRQVDLRFAHPGGGRRIRGRVRFLGIGFPLRWRRTYVGNGKGGPIAYDHQEAVLNSVDHAFPDGTGG
jgi:hypothetical protein